MAQKFKLEDEAYAVIETAKDVARRLVRETKATPLQIIGLGHALYALERLPLVTDWVECEFGIQYESGTDKFSEMHYITVRISRDELEICDGGSAYDSSVGSDSFSNPGCRVEQEGFCEIECDLWGIKNSISEYLNLGADITVRDDSDLDGVCLVEEDDEVEDDDEDEFDEDDVED